MMLFSQYRGFLITLVPAAIGGFFWSYLGLPLAWLMGAAVVTGLLSIYGLMVQLPKQLYWPSLCVIGAGVGLTITPDVAVKIATYFPIMAVMAFVGVVLALIATPLVARKGNMKASTAFFSLMPGGVIEMANIGGPYGADRTTIATLHAVRVALVVGILPLSLYFLFPNASVFLASHAILSPADLAIVLAVALAGGWMGKKVHLPASWLLGSLLAVALLTVSGSVTGQIPEALMAVAQIIVGMSLGSKFQKERLCHLPKAMAVGTIALLAIILTVALLAVFISQILPIDVPTMVLALSIGGLPEMVLTARYLELDMAMVAAFQSTRAVLVNSLAGAIWYRFHKFITQDR